jgi:signal transduction histidine kinase
MVYLKMRGCGQPHSSAFLQALLHGFFRPHTASGGLRNFLLRYGFATLIILVALWVRFSITPLVGNQSPFMVLAPAALVAAGFAGLGPGIMALVAALILGHYFFAPPPGSWSHLGPAEISMMVTYGAANLVAVFLFHFLRKSRFAAVESAERAFRRGEDLEREINERKRVEAELKIARDKLNNYATELEEQVALRTEAMQESIRSLESILYHLAHDLRAPLRAMQGFSSLLAGPHAGQLDEAGKDCADRVSNAAQQMDVLLQDLLEYGRVCSVQLAPVKILLRPVLELVVKRLSGHMERTQAQIHIEGSFPAVWADSTLLQQVFLNLLSNALKFVVPSSTKPEGHVWAEPKGAHVRVWVEDNGIGISPEHYERIFRVFERLHVNSSFPGTGIGLPSAKKAVERMGGSLGVEPTEGGGSRFWVELLVSPPPLS